MTSSTTLRWRGRQLLLASACVLVIALAGCLPMPAADLVEPTFTPTPFPTATPTPFPTSTPTPAPEVAGFGVTLTEAQLNQLVTDSLAQSPDIPLSNVVVSLYPGLIVATGRADLGLLAVNLEVVASVAVVDGEARPQVEQVRVNRAQAPDFLRNQVNSIITPFLEQLTRTAADVYVERVEITDDYLRIEGRYQ